MVSSIPMNMGYNNNPYVVMPLNKTRDDGMTVESSTPATKPYKPIPKIYWNVILKAYKIIASLKSFLVQNTIPF